MIQKENQRVQQDMTQGASNLLDSLKISHPQNGVPRNIFFNKTQLHSTHSRIREWRTHESKGSGSGHSIREHSTRGRGRVSSNRINSIFKPPIARTHARRMCR